VSDANPVLESERLRECLEAAQAVLRAAEEEAETIHAQLADVDGRVAGKFLSGITIFLLLGSSFI
jgi:hypothetical protein